MTTDRAVAVTLAAVSLSGCILFRDKDLPCDRLGLCETATADSGVHDASGADVDASDTLSSSRGPTDGAPAAEDVDVSDAHDAATEQGLSVPDGALDATMDATDAAACDRAKPPSDMPCTIDEAYGVFVAPVAVGMANDGTRAHPFTSLSDAMRQAKAAGKRVYVCDDGTGYTASIAVGPSADGVTVFGGFECVGWTYDTMRRAKLTAATSPVLTVTNLVTGIAFENFEIVAPDASSPGGSSVGVVVNECDSVVLRRVSVTAGRGQHGTNGENGGGSSNAQAVTGEQGRPGLTACTPDPRGGSAVTRTCNDLDPSTSGWGGNGAINAVAGGDNGGNGFPSYAAGKGGTGEPVTGAWDCGLGGGQNGSNGPTGSSGSNGTGLGSLTLDGWKGLAGSDGTAGKPGQGGGGGGGAKAPTDANVCTLLDGGAPTITGASGGSGGGGGCGGRGGKGGMAGGSSIALVSINSSVTLESCELTASEAGKGGNGGQGQRGGDGGNGGAGGSGVGSGATGSKNACSGGQGGQGGSGGDGGGGAGGHSIGVAYLGKAPAGLDPTAVKVGANGIGGQAGGGAGKGDDGVFAVSRPFDGADAGK